MSLTPPPAAVFSQKRARAPYYPGHPLLLPTLSQLAGFSFSKLESPTKVLTVLSLNLLNQVLVHPPSLPLYESLVMNGKLAKNSNEWNYGNMVTLRGIQRNKMVVCGR